jgi:hypothetical protein
MTSFISTDSQGNFTLDGKTWFLHAAVYFGRRPGTCGADWMGKNFQHNLAFLDNDIDTMNRLGINTMRLVIPAFKFFNGVQPVAEYFDQLEFFFEKVKKGGLRLLISEIGSISQEAWCKEYGIQPSPGELWNPAIQPEAEKALIESKRILRTRFASRQEIIGWRTDVSRFFEFKFSVPPLQKTWTAWLQRRFDWDFAKVRELFDLQADEYNWDRVRMPTEMEHYFDQNNPRSYELSLMQQVLVTKAANRIIRAVRPFTPNHLIFSGMEGCCFSTGHLTSYIPDDVEADAYSIECYHWEGLRSYYYWQDDPARPMAEPIANKPSVEILNSAGYIQMLTQLMKRNHMPLVICHGVDIGDKRRGVRDEADQNLIIDRENTFFLESGGTGVAYWCWSDDELSKTYTQAGETMGIVRYDGSPRPIGEKLRRLTEQQAGKSVRETPNQVLVLLPAPVFEGLYRYRANLSAFGMFTSLGRQGILASSMFTAAGEKKISLEDIRSYPLVILGASSYQRDFPEIPEILQQYVENGGTLFFSLAECDTLVDPYLKVRLSPALKVLSGCTSSKRVEQKTLDGIEGQHPAFTENLAKSWELDMDEPAYFSQVQLQPGAEILATANGQPLLYRHKLGKGMIYIFTWNMDVFIYEGQTLDHYSDRWDWLWKGIATETRIEQELDNPIRKAIMQIVG